jgi:hypothetical protein
MVGVTVNVSVPDGFPFGEVIVAVTAVLAALIAAVTAQIRLRAQLDHDRRMRDRDELRTLLDESAREVHDLYEAISGLEDEAHAEVHDLDEFDETMGDAITEASRHLYGLRPANSRLQLRLPPDHEIVQTHGRIWWVALQTVLAVAFVARERAGLPENPELLTIAKLSDEQRRELMKAIERAASGDVERLDAELGVVRHDFISSCRSYLSGLEK